MKIQLKRSNVLESGKAKEPTADQMEYGELAVNFNADDPAVFIKDNDNKIIRIGGVGNIADDGQTEIPAGPNPPLNPQPGNFWYNSEDGRLYYYYEDANSSQWVDASPDSQSNPVESGPTFPATALPDDLFFNTTDGRLYIYYKDGDSEQWVDASPDIQPQTNDLWKRDGTTVLPKTTGDSVEIGGSAEGNGKITLNANGSAEFAGGDLTIRDDGMLYTKGDLRVGGSDKDNPNIFLRLNGSADFVGHVKTTDQFRVDHPASALNAAIFANCGSDGATALSIAGPSNTPAASIFANGSADFAGGAVEINSLGSVYVKRTGGGETCFVAGLNAVQNAKIFADGSASFANQIVSGTTTQRGSFKAYATGNNGARCLLIQNPNDSSLNYASINGDGSAEFGSGNITLAADGSITAAGDVQIGAYNPATNSGVEGAYIYSSGAHVTNRTGEYDTVLQGKLNNVETSRIWGNGTIVTAGDVKIGTTGSFTPSTPAISLNAADGSITATSFIKVTDGEASANQSVLTTSGITSQRDTSDAGKYVWRGFGGDTETSAIYSDGSAEFAGDVSAPNFIGSSGSFNAGGSGGPSIKTKQQPIPIEFFTGNGTINKKRVHISAGGDMFIGNFENDGGSVPPSAPAITLEAEGSAEFKSAGAQKIQIRPTLADGTSAYALRLLNSSDKVMWTLDTDGTAKFDGNVTANGTILTRNVELKLEADDDTKYTATTNEEGEQTLVYNGATLDVKELLLSLQTAAARIEALEARLDAAGV